MAKQLFSAVVVAMTMLGGREASGVTQAWTRQFGTTTRDFATGVATDRLGGIYVAGQTEASLTGPHEGFTDAFIRKYDAAGNVIWGRQLGTNRGDYGKAVSADGLGAVYIVGGTSGGLSGSNLGSQDAFLTKYSATGTPTWTRQIGTHHSDVGSGVVADGLGSIYICGRTDGNLNGEFNSANADAFVAKYDSFGTMIWTRLVGTPEHDTGNSLAIDNLGSIYLAGQTTGDLDGFSGESDAFLAKFDTEGNRVWTRQLGTSFGESGLGVSADALGNVYLTGYTQGDLASPGADSQDAFVSKYDAAGELKWTRQFGSSDRDEGNAVAADGLGNVYASGHIYTSAAPGSDRSDIFIRKYDADGTLLWGQQFGTGDNDYGLGVSLDGHGSVYLSGELDSDAFIAKVTDIFGDYTGDAKIDGADFLNWQRQLGLTVPAFSGADGDGDGAVDTGDLLVWQDHFGDSTHSRVVLRSVPEPAGNLSGMLSLALCTLYRYRPLRRCDHRLGDLSHR